MKALPKIVQWQLQRTSSVSALPHPDADLLTAFIEQSLPRSERTTVLEHLAQCSECRQITALAESPVTLPSIKLRSAHSWRLVLAWSGMAACLLIAVAFVHSGRNQHKELAEAIQQQSSATQNSRTTSLPDYSEVGARAKELKAGTGRSSNSKKTAEAVQHQVMAYDMLQSIPKTPQNRAMGKDKSAQPASPGLMAGTTSSPRQAAAPSGEDAATSTNDMRESFAPSVPNTSVPTSNIDDRYPRWTLNSDGILLRSLDTGASWQKISIPGNAALLHSIATVGTDVWVGGASGTLYHSADEGGHWTQVTPANGDQLLADDVISIEFATAQRGKFITSKQEVWATADGGETWSKK